MYRWIIVMFLLVWVHPAFALAVDVGMLTQVDGKVTVAAAKGTKRTATAYQKVALGDRLVLGKGAGIQIVYFETSRQEKWTGAGEIEIGNGEGRSSSLKVEARKLPPLVARQLVKTPATGQHGKTGMVTVRSLSSDTVESLEKQYNEFRRAAAAGDTTPEIFLLTGLMEMKEYERAMAVLNDLKAKSSSAPELANVVLHFEPLVKEAIAGQ